MMRRSLVPFALAGSVLMTACGSDNGVTPTPNPTPTPVPTAGPVTIQVSGTGVVAGIPVLLSDAAGLPVGATETDATGQASFVLQPGTKSMVTVINQSTEKYGNINIETFTDIGPGDKIQTAPAPTFDLGASQGSVVIDFGDRGPEGTLEYLIQVDGCGILGAAFPPYVRLQGYVLDIPSVCKLGAGNTVDLTLYAMNGDLLVLAYASHPGVAIAVNTKTPVTFDGGWKTDLTAFPLTYKNVPAPFTQLNLVLFPVRGAFSSSFFSLGPTYGVTAGQTDTQTLYYAKALSNRVGYGLLLKEKDDFHGAQMEYLHFAAGFPASATVDLATELPAQVTSVSKTDGATFRPGAAWTTSGSVAGMSLGTVSFNWKRGTQFVSWNVNFPPTTASPLNVPEIPDYLAFARPTGDDGTFLGGVSFSYSSGFAGYHDAIKAGGIVDVPAGDATLTFTARTP